MLIGAEDNSLRQIFDLAAKWREKARKLDADLRRQSSRGMMGARFWFKGVRFVERYETSPSFEIAVGLFAIAAWVAILGYAFHRML